MADNLPINFAIPGEQITATYDYYDVAEGTGITAFYGSIDAAGNAVLSTQSMFSAAIQTTTTTSTELNFNLAPFNRPRTIKGTAMVSYGMNVQGNTGGATMLVTFYKVSATVETSMGTCTVSQNKPYDLGGFLSATMTETHFAIGDNLRISVLLTDNSDTAIAIGHDPKNRDGTGSYGGYTLDITPSTKAYTTTQLIFYIPFKIDN